MVVLDIEKGMTLLKRGAKAVVLYWPGPDPDHYSGWSIDGRPMWAYIPASDFSWVHVYGLMARDRGYGVVMTMYGGKPILAQVELFKSEQAISEAMTLSGMNLPESPLNYRISKWTDGIPSFDTDFTHIENREPR